MRLRCIQQAFLSMRDLQSDTTLTNLSGWNILSSRASNSTVVLVWKLHIPRNELLETMVDLMVCFLALVILCSVLSIYQFWLPSFPEIFLRTLSSFQTEVLKNTGMQYSTKSVYETNQKKNTGSICSQLHTMINEASPVFQNPTIDNVKSNWHKSWIFGSKQTHDTIP